MLEKDIEDYIYEDITKANHISNCDLRYVLRNIIHRGIEEANYRYMLSNGSKAIAYRRLKLLLIRTIDDLDVAVNADGEIVHRHRHTLRQALAYARYLTAIEREETASQFEILEDRLKNPRQTYFSQLKRVA